jgi:hypothetical protein
MHVQPTPEHQWLQQFLGEWTMETEATMGPDEPPMKFTAIETVRAIGKVWVQCESREMPGGEPMTAILTLGYDPARQRYVGTFVGSMMTHQWVYDGYLDAARRVLTLDTEGPDFGSPDLKLTKYQDIIEFHSPDHRTLTSRMLQADGTWLQVVTTEYRRKA